MDAKHTPGPWFTGLPNHKDSSAIGIRGEMWVIADMCDDGYSDEVQEANARLIAAAPTMYDVIKYAVDNPNFESGVFDIICRSALKEATGAAP